MAKCNPILEETFTIHATQYVYQNILLMSTSSARLINYTFYFFAVLHMSMLLCCPGHLTPVAELHHRQLHHLGTSFTSLFNETCSRSVFSGDTYDILRKVIVPLFIIKRKSSHFAHSC